MVRHDRATLREATTPAACGICGPIGHWTAASRMPHVGRYEQLRSCLLARPTGQDAPGALRCPMSAIVDELHDWTDRVNEDNG